MIGEIPQMRKRGLCPLKVASQLSCELSCQGGVRTTVSSHSRQNPRLIRDNKVSMTRSCGCHGGYGRPLTNLRVD